MKAGSYILIAYLIIALYIMYRRSQSVACKMTPSQLQVVRLMPIGQSMSCDIIQDIILPGLTLGLYSNNSIPATAPAVLTDEQKCGPMPQVQPGGSASCQFVNGSWVWITTPGGPPANTIQRIFGY